MKSNLFQPGVGTYAEWLRTLTPKEKEQHLKLRAERKKKRNLEKELKEIFMANADQWIAEFNNATVSILKKAQDGDVAAYNAVGDRVFGKPKSPVDVTSNGNTIDSTSTMVATADSLIEKLKSREKK